jgi:predicted dehydrogenase
VGGTLRIGIVGAGKISGQYSATLARLPELVVTAVADLDRGRAQDLADQHDEARVVALPEMYAADDVDVVLNLTTPAGHAPVALAALAAGKHVYGEKPLAATSTDGRAIVDAAATAGRRAACAPDTVLGTGVQTARAALDDGAIGAAHAATAFMTVPGHERWHPDPEFYYQPGGGPLFDMGPYYLTTLVHLLGPVRRVVGMAARPRDERTIATGPRAGTSFPVAVDTHETALLEHASGAVTTLVMSFDVWASQLPRIEIYGATGSLSVPDPNYFAGDVRLYTRDAPEWTTLAPSAGYVDAGRGIGLLDLYEAQAAGRPHRTGVDVALHVLDVMESVQASAAGSRPVTLGTTCERPERLDGLITLSS